MASNLKRVYYGWVMIIPAAIILATNAIVFYSFGMFLIPVTTQFGWERGSLSAALALNMVTAGILGILAGKLSDKYGPRILIAVGGIFSGTGFILLSYISSLWQVYLIWGLLLAIGGSESYIPIMSTISRWFVDKKGVAIGLTATGFGLGGIIAPILSQWLITDYGWRQAYMVLGALIIIVIVPLSLLIKKSPQEIGVKPYGEQASVIDECFLSSADNISLRQAIKTGRFWIFGTIQMGFLFSIQVITAHIAPHAIDTGIPDVIAASIVSIFAATSLVGRNLVGFISDKLGARLTLTTCLFILTLSLVWLLFAEEIWMFYLFAVLYGIAYGGVVPVQTLVTGDLFGLKYLGTLMAVLMLFGTLGGALGAPLAGYIFDVTTSYHSAFIICIILCVLALILSFVLLRSRKNAAMSG